VDGGISLKIGVAEPIAGMYRAEPPGLATVFIRHRWGGRIGVLWLSTQAGLPFVTTMLDAGVSLRDVQIAARHADPRITMSYDRARKNLDRHPNYILAAYMASRT